MLIAAPSPVSLPDAGDPSRYTTTGKQGAPRSRSHGAATPLVIGRGASHYGPVFVYGLFAVGNEDLNFLSINSADNILHLLSALVGLAIALWPARDRRTTPAT